jgi:hypothetical protein
MLARRKFLLLGGDFCRGGEGQDEGLYRCRPINPLAGRKGCVYCQLSDLPAAHWGGLGNPPYRCLAGFAHFHKITIRAGLFWRKIQVYTK